MRMDESKTKEQLIAELDEMRKKLSKFKRTETQCNKGNATSLDSEEYHRLGRNSVVLPATFVKMTGAVSEASEAGRYPNSRKKGRNNFA